MLNTPWYITKHVKGKENVIHSRRKRITKETDSETVEILELSNKDIK